MSAPILHPLNLQLGWPSKSLFPVEALHAATSATLLNPELAGDALIYGPDEGYLPLRHSLGEWLASFYHSRRKSNAESSTSTTTTAGTIAFDRIFIGNGASATLGIILGKFTDPIYTRKVFMIEPTYFLACPIVEDAGFEGRLKGVPEDEEGLDVEFLREALQTTEAEMETTKEEATNGHSHDKGNDDENIRNVGSTARRSGRSEAKYPKLYRYVIYAVPTFANPSGKVMSLRRREELVRLARKYDALVITDDVYDMLRWPTDPTVSATELPPPPPRLCDVDRYMPGQNKWGNAVSNGSFSKIVGPGTRVSWVEGTSEFIRVLSTHGATKSGGSPGHMTSVFMDQMIRNGTLDRHIQEVLVPTYRKRYAVLMDAVKEYLVPLGVKITTGQAYKHHSDESTQSVSSSSPTKQVTDIAEAGGFFTYLDLPDDVQPASNVAKIALDCYALKFAHGSMMLAAGDADCLNRAKTSFGRGARLSWSWHDEGEIREGIERLAEVIRDIRAGKVKRVEQSLKSAMLFNRN